ncbi:hypothetical protein ATI53_1001222 [Salipiger aestuarii]|uniref:Uncharacterized protein n=1 Tax=Salipiger aestuarii TaxID=568098 RepID=A0A327YWQ5_9RHOB|nr:hypothetical protein [Salipiger aestuarii]RAK24115.1 hypothetical protein ATI53_1001222 [Salipiger aestuarii]
MRRDFRQTTALSDPRVFQPQVAGFAFGALGGTAAAGASAGFAAGAAAGATFAASTFGGIVVQATLSIGLAAVAAALQGAPKAPKPSSSMVSYTNPVSYAEWCIGTVRKGGMLGFDGEKNKYRHQITVHCAHPIEAFLQTYLDEIPVTYNGIGEVSGGPGGYAYVTELPGEAGQTLPARIRDDFGPGSDKELTDAHDFVGLGCSYFRGKRVSTEEVADRYPTGRMWVATPIFKGLNTIYDPRSDSTGWTDNFALGFAWWLTERMGVSVDWDDVAIEADACDVPITDRYGVTRAKWRLNCTLSDDQDFETQRAMLCAAADVFLYEGIDGKVGFKVGRYSAPTVTLTARDFLEVQMTSGRSGSSAPTEIVPEYIEPDNVYREWSTGTWVVGPGNQTKRDTPQLYAVDNHNQAIRIAKRLGTISRAEWQLSGGIGAIGYELIGERFFRFQHAELGMDEVFEVSTLRRESVGTWSIEAVSVTAADFDFDSATEEPARPEIDVETYTAISVDDVTGVSATSPSSGVLRVDWDTQDDLYDQEVIYTRQADGEVFYATWDASDYTEIRGLESGDVYTVQVRNTYGSTKGTAFPTTPIEVTISSAAAPSPPDAPVISSTSAVTGEVSFVGTAAARSSSIRVYMAATDDFSAATALTPLKPVGAGAFEFTISTDPDPTGYYWLAALSSDGSEGPVSTSQYLTIS